MDLHLGGGLLATGIVLGTFGLLFVDHLEQYPVSRSVTAATGAVLLIGLGIVSPERALQAVSVQTILLLFGMLVHVAVLARSGFYDWVATQLVLRAQTPRRLTLGALGLAGILSAFALNDATVLLLAPVLITAANEGDTDPVPPLLAVIFGANIGSVATPLGNPQNAFIISESSMATTTFVSVLAPVGLVSLVVAGAFLWPTVSSEGTLSKPSIPEFDRRWALTSIGFLVVTFGLLLVVNSVEAGTVAASTATLHLVWLQGSHRIAGDEIFGDVDWSILVLFTGLFALIAGLDGTRLLELVNSVHGPLRLGGAVFVLSNLVSNVPAVVLLSTGLSADATTGWLVLAAASTLAGNATPIASAATLILLKRAANDDVTIPIRELLRLGIPVAVSTTVLGIGMVVFLTG